MRRSLAFQSPCWHFPLLLCLQGGLEGLSPSHEQHSPQPLWLPPPSPCPRSAELPKLLWQRLALAVLAVPQVEKHSMPPYPSPPGWGESLLRTAWFSIQAINFHRNLTLRISLQRDLLVVKIQIGKVVAEFAGLPENLTEVDPIKALFSSVLSEKLESFKKMFSGNFPPNSYFIYLRNF